MALEILRYFQCGQLKVIMVYFERKGCVQRNLYLNCRRCAHCDCDALWMKNFQDGGESREISQVICFIF